MQLAAPLCGRHHGALAAYRCVQVSPAWILIFLAFLFGVSVWQRHVVTHLVYDEVDVLPQEQHGATHVSHKRKPRAQRLAQHDGYTSVRSMLPGSRLRYTNHHWLSERTRSGAGFTMLSCWYACRARRAWGTLPACFAAQCRPRAERRPHDQLSASVVGAAGSTMLAQLVHHLTLMHPDLHWRRIRVRAPPVALTVYYGYLLEDALAALDHCGGALRGRRAVTFIDAHGAPKAGGDAGGLFKELLTELVRDVFDPLRGLFSATPHAALLHHSAAAAAALEGWQLLRFAGLVVAKALYEGVLLELALALRLIRRAAAPPTVPRLPAGPCC